MKWKGKCKHFPWVGEALSFLHLLWSEGYEDTKSRLNKATQPDNHHHPFARWSASEQASKGKQLVLSVHPQSLSWF
jgi:hypothetical protein